MDDAGGAIDATLFVMSSALVNATCWAVERS